MKRIFRLAALCSLLLTALSACVSEETNFDKPQPVLPGDTGYLAFSDGGLTVITDAEIMRSTVVDVDSFTCDIISDKSGETVMSFTYGNRPSEPIELKVGSYKLNIKSGDITPMDWEKPVYGAVVPFSIEKNETNTLETIKCKLMNIKVTVGYDAALYDLLEAGSVTDVTIAQNKMSFDYTEQRAAYFESGAAENKMLVEMSLNYAGKSAKMSAEIAGVKAGQWRKITVNMPHVNEGNVVFTITIETLTVDEEIIVDVAEMQTLSEEVIPDDPSGDDPTAPQITWSGHDLDETFQLKASHFDDSNTCTIPVVINIATKGEAVIDALNVNIASTSAEFMESLASMNILTDFDLCQVDATTNPTLNTALGMIGFKTGSNVKGKSSVDFELTKVMNLLYTFTGTHTFTLNVVDDLGKSTTKALKILVDPNSESGEGGANAPTIVWVDHDIKQAYSVTSDLQVKLEVSAPAGIKEFIIDIESDLLTDSELSSVGLSTHLDLVNPGSLVAPLTGLGFPNGDDVKNKTSLTFDISSFMGALLGISGGSPCYADFVMQITDNSGNKTVETLQLLINQ